MLKKENRLKARCAFSATYNNRNIVGNNMIVMYAGKIKTDKDCPTRVGFVVSKKIHKRAVIRNRLKRLMRENIRLIFKNKENDTLENYQSIILVAKSGLIDKSFGEIRDTILILLNKLANKNI